jgi:hypothetical protein
MEVRDGIFVCGALRWPAQGKVERNFLSAPKAIVSPLLT